MPFALARSDRRVASSTTNRFPKNGIAGSYNSREFFLVGFTQHRAQDNHSGSRHHELIRRTRTSTQNFTKFLSCPLHTVMCGAAANSTTSSCLEQYRLIERICSGLFVPEGSIQRIAQTQNSKEFYMCRTHCCTMALCVFHKRLLGSFHIEMPHEKTIPRIVRFPTATHRMRVFFSQQKRYTSLPRKRTLCACHTPVQDAGRCTL